MYEVTESNPSTGSVDSKYFPAEREMFLYLESIGVTYYAERGFTELADGRLFEYGRMGL